MLAVLGIVEGVIGPTLLDLKDFMGVSLGSISFIIMVSSIGSMVGCFLSGYVMDKLVKLQYLMLAGDTLYFPKFTILLDTRTSGAAGALSLVPRFAR